MTVKIHRGKTAFARKAGRAGGIGLEEAVAAAEARLEEVRDKAVGEIDGELSALVDRVRAMSEPPSTADISAVYRSADKVTALSGLFGMGVLGEAASSLCKLLDPGQGKPARREAIRVHADTMMLIRAQGDDKAARALAPLLVQLRVLVEQELAG